jgi:hypothetical protein
MAVVTSKGQVALPRGADRRLIRDGMTTDEFMELSGGEITTSRRHKK